jgi:hypothetical protein
MGAARYSPAGSGVKGSRAASRRAAVAVYLQGRKGLSVEAGNQAALPYFFGANVEPDAVPVS